MCKWTDRDAQINKACQEFSSDRDTRIGFCNGAKWSDEHPRKGLVDINEVCEWLDGFLDETPLIEYQVPEDGKKRIIKSFVKAMEG